MFSIKWEYICYECNCPMGIRLVITEPIEKLPKFLKRIGSWYHLKPFNLLNNTWFYKFYGGTSCRRVCVSCYYEPTRVNLLSRETGTKKLALSKVERPKTQQEIFDYYTSFVNSDMCIVSESKRRDLPGIRMFIRIII